MKSVFISVYMLSVALFTGAQDNLPESDREAIISTFKMTETAWNAGDIEGFMQGYWKSDQLVFIGSNGPNYGYEATLEKYKKSYPDKAAMGKLTFTIIDIRQVDVSCAILTGKFYLEREAPDMAGLYTLVWKKIDGQWLIIHDHSSPEG